MDTREQEIFYALWRYLDLPGDFVGGELLLPCFKCTDKLTVLSDGLECAPCKWRATGDPWSVAKAAKSLAIPAAATSKLPPIIMGSYIQANKPVLPDVLIEGMLHRGAKMVLGGGSKSYKTWCLIDLGLSLHKGVPWWGRKTRQGIVVYLNFEVQEGFFAERLQAVALAKGIEVDDSFRVWNLRGHSTDHSTLLPMITEMLRGMNVAAIILDPTYKIMTKSENAQEEVAAMMSSIEKMALATGAAVIFGSHFAKGNASGKEAIDRISGSGVFARDPDAILTMTRHEEDDVFSIDPILRNCAPVPAFCVKWLFPLMRAHDADPEKLKQVPGQKAAKALPAPSEVAKYLRNAGGVLKGTKHVEGSLAKLIASETGLGLARAEQAIRDAVRAAEIEETQEVNGRNPVRVYRLTHRPAGES